MQRVELDSVTLYNAFVSGGREIIRRREEINKINVFPVADGDTGTNLALTMGSVVERSSPRPTAGQTMRSMADAALSGARGNSGIIFAQFLAGLGESMGERPSVSSEGFAEAARHAERRAREAVLAPVEGTILTVIGDWVRSLEEHQHLRDFGLIFQRTLRGAKRSLDRTPELLPALKKAGVVDAGAEGFVRFLSGATEYLVSDASALPSGAAGAEASLAELPPSIHGGEYPAFRYCVELLLRGEGIDLGKLRAELAGLGDCGIAAGGGGRARVHVHSDDPALVLRRLSAYGAVEEQKVDDMLREYEVVHARKHPIALVTDSACDLPKALLDEHQIHVLPLSINLGSAAYLDGLTIGNEDIYAALESGGPSPTSSQPSPAAARLLYSFLSTYYESIIAIHVSAKLSGTYSLSSREAERFPGKRISVVDSRLNSGAQALLVLRAAELIAAGKGHDEVLAALESSIPKARILVAVPTLRHMVKGGRVGPLKGALARLLNLKPIVSLDEAGGSALRGAAFSMRRCAARIVRLAAEFAGGGELRAYGVVHAGDPEAARDFAARLEAALGKKPLFIQEISSVIALNAGRGALAAVLMKE
ncbi:MAG TPA: DegV family protein [Spirochaetales bacterium]|nr:DegV family protein [Spirochaetales bacterium]HRY54972.1 DegV family protein [Spirochaetia bacterium]HRZ64841.1 DegV family protein [Spirochaetia bacterium]